MKHKYVWGQGNLRLAHSASKITKTVTSLNNLNNVHAQYDDDNDLLDVFSHNKKAMRQAIKTVIKHGLVSGTVTEWMMNVEDDSEGH